MRNAILSRFIAFDYQLLATLLPAVALFLSYRPIKVNIGTPAVDQNFGGFLFKDATADAFVRELPASFAFELRLLGDFGVGHPSLLFKFGGVCYGSGLEECAPGGFYGRSHGWFFCLSHRFTLVELSV